MSAITLDNVSKRYGDVHALRPLSVEFPAGKLSTIFGKSGSGKTTLLSNRGNNSLRAGTSENGNWSSGTPVPRRNLRWGAAAGGYRSGHRGHPNRAAR